MQTMCLVAPTRATVDSRGRDRDGSGEFTVNAT